jgi:hypothetical protein
VLASSFSDPPTLFRLSDHTHLDSRNPLRCKDFRVLGGMAVGPDSTRAYPRQNYGARCRAAVGYLAIV